jgi:uncharacterized protein YjbJ (UPF0337 family)
MNLLQPFRRFFITISLVFLLGTITAFSAKDSLAANSLTQPISLASTQIATLNRIEAITKNIEGKAQEAMGNLTGDKKDQVIGKAKQVESRFRNTVENIKDTNWPQKSKVVQKDIEAKTEEAMDNSIVNPNYLPGGKTKDTEIQSRNPADKIKDDLHNAF